MRLGDFCACCGVIFLVKRDELVVFLCAATVDVIKAFVLSLSVEKR